MSGHDKGGTRGRRGAADHDEHEEHVNHEAWVIPYADLLTLLMAMFIALFAMGTVDKEKFEAVAESFRKELGGGGSPIVMEGSASNSPLSGAGSVLDGFGPAPVRSDLPGQPVSTTIPAGIAPGEIQVGPIDIGSAGSVPPATFAVIPTADQVMGDALTEVEQVIQTRIVGTGLAGALQFRREARGLVVTIVTDQVLFDEAQATIQPDGLDVLDVVADALLDVPNAVMIEGHTDSRPLHGGRFADNWDLSTARATSVLRYFIDNGFPQQRLSASGYGDTRPVDPGTSAEALARNRRVEVVVLTTAVSPPPTTATSASPTSTD